MFKSLIDWICGTRHAREYAWPQWPLEELRNRVDRE